jgi:hypothetical protein
VRSPPGSVHSRCEGDQLSLCASRVELGDDERNRNGSILDVPNRWLELVENALERDRHDFSDIPVIDNRLVEDGGMEGPLSCYRERGVLVSAGGSELSLGRWAT